MKKNANPSSTYRTTIGALQSPKLLSEAGQGSEIPSGYYAPAILLNFSFLRALFVTLVISFGCTLFSYAQSGDISATSTAKTLKTGGGGWMTGMHIHPSGTPVLARTDVGTPVIWNETTKTWTNLVTTATMPAGYALDNLDYAQGKNSFSGAVSIVSDPSNANTLYMAFNDTKNNYGEGCIFKSTDQGKHWAVTGLCGFIALPNVDGTKVQGEKICVDPNNSNVVYFGTSANGLYRTDNAGTSWSTVTSVSKGNESTYGVGIVLIDPSSGTTTRNGLTVTKNIYATVHNTGVYQSTDGGANFTLMTGYTAGQIDDAEVVNGVLVIASSGQVWKYKNGLWSNISSGTSQPYEIAIDPTNTDRIFALGYAGNIYRTTDGGATGFQALSKATSGTDVPWLSWIDGSYLSVGALQFDPKVAGQLWFAEGTGMWRCSNITGSTITWSSISAGIENMVANDVIAPPGSVPLTAFWDQKFFYRDNLDTYPAQKKPDNIFGSCWDLDYVEKNPLQIVGLIQDHTGGHPPTKQSGYSLDGGKTWNIFSAITNGTLPGDLQYGNMAVSCNNLNNIVWLPSSQGLPYYTKDRGATWYKVNEGSNATDGGHHAYYSSKEVLQSDRATDGVFYIYNWNYGFYKSIDGGASWVQSANNPPLGAWQAILRSVPGNAGHLFWASGYNSKKPLYHSINGGNTWITMTNVDAAYMIALGKKSPTATYPTLFLYGIVGGKEGLYRSTDEGANWDFITAAVEGSFDTPTAMDGDKDIYGRVYIGYLGSSFKYVDAAGVSTVTAPPKGNGTGITGSYFNSKDLTGTPVVRIDDNINFDFGLNAPGIGSLGIDNFSIRWTGKMEAPVAGTYTFRTFSDDGIRVWVNGIKIIDAWIDQGAGNPNVGTPVTLAANTKYDLKVEYYEATGAASAKLEWNFPGQSYTSVPKDRLYPDGTVTTVAVTSVNIVPTSISVATGATSQLSAIVSPSNASNQNVLWSSSNANIASVSATGLVTGVSAGTATVTVTTQDGNKTDVCTVNVTGSGGGGTTTNLALNKSATASSQQTGNEANKGNDGSGTTRWASYDQFFPKTWTVDLGANYSLSKVEIDWENATSTYLYKIETSADNITFATALDKTGNTAQGKTSDAISVSSARYVRINVTGFTGTYAWASFYECRVFGSSSSSTVAVTGVSVSPTTATIGVGATTTLTATVAPSNATNTAVTWSSSNTSVATVSSSGVVTGLANGIATITVTSVADASKTATTTITVATASNLALNKSATASSQQTGNEANKGNDGSGTTRWASYDQFFPKTWTVDLGANYSLSKVEIDWENATSTYLYKIETSADNITFATALDKTGNTAQGKTSDAISVSSARYVRINVTGFTGTYAWASFYECRVFGVSTARLASSEKGVKANSEAGSFKLTLTPNPAENEVTVYFEAPEGAVSVINVTDLNGRIVHSITATGTTAVINVSALKRGLYILRVNNSINSTATKLLVQ